MICPGQTGSKSRGFTLIEVVVSLLVFSLLSVLAWQGLYQIVQLEERGREQVQVQNRINRAWAVMVQDLLHLRPRTLRDSLGGVQPALETGEGAFLLRFSRGGLPVMAGYIPNGMQRVVYQLDDGGQLVRRSSPLLDGYAENGSRSRVLLEGVQAIEFGFLDSANYFQPNWPPINQQVDPRELPRLIRVRLVLADGLEFERLLPGVSTLLPRRPANDQDESEGSQGGQQ